MAAEPDYGLVHLKLMPAITNGAKAGSYPDFDTLTGGFKVTAIVKDSFSYNDQAESKTNIEIEDSDDYFLTIKTDGGSRGFQCETYDMSYDAFAYFFGYEKDQTEEGWINEAVSFDLKAQAVEIRTRAKDNYPAKVYQYAKMDVSVVRTGTIGKSGLPNLQLTFTKLANYDANGVEISGSRFKMVSES